MKKKATMICAILCALFAVGCQTKQANTETEVKTETPKLMWFDATANFERFNHKDSIDFYLAKIQSLGFTDAVVDVRPISGHVLYRSAYAPFLEEWEGVKRDESFDFLGYFIERAHANGLKIHAALNTFVAGHNYKNSGVVFGEHPEWATIAYTPDQGLVPIMSVPKKYSAMVNPIIPEYQEYILNIFREVVQKYPSLDGIILDRVRYDGFMADFSELSRAKFEEYLGAKVERFPEDVYEWKKDDKGAYYPEKGKHYLQWLEWRAMNIRDFMEKARNEVKAVNPALSFGTYTGAWYPSYYEVGVNFASKEYDPSKEFDWASPTYQKTGYAELIDLYMVGNYYTSITKEAYMAEDKAVQNETDMQAQRNIWYCVEGSCENLRRVLGENKFLGGILVDQFYENPEGLTESIKMNLAKSDGLMVFDIVHIIHKDMWDAVEKGMREGGALPAEAK